MTTPPLPDAEALVAELPVAVYRTTPQGRFVAGNRRLAELLGADSVEELLDVDVRSLYVDSGHRSELLARIASGVAIPTEEIEIERLDGRRIWVRVSSRPVLDESGELRQLEGVLEDVTETKRVAAELVRTNELLDTLSRIQNRYIAGADPGLLFDRLLDDLLASTDSGYGFIAQVMYDEERNQFLRTYAMSDISWNEATRRMFAEKGPRGMEFHNLDNLFGRAITDKEPIIANDPKNDPRGGGRPHGHPPLNSFLGVPILKGDDVLGMLALSNRPGGYDETIVANLEPLTATVGSMIEAIRSDAARRQAEEREGASQRLYRAVVDNASEAVVAIGPHGVIEACNPASEKLTGYSESDLIGESIYSLLGKDHADLVRRLAVADVHLASMTELSLVRGDGTEIPVEVSYARTDIGDRVLTTAIVRNIAERKATEEALLAAKEAAERTSRAKDDFLAGMSHELRTPLNAVIGLSTILGREIHGELNEKQHEYVSQIESSGRHLLELINDILDLAKIEAQKLEPEPAAVAVGPLVEAAVAVLRETALAKQLQLELAVDAGLPAVWADARRTKQVLLNLLSNAVKFTESGGRVGVTAKVTGAMLAVTVWDTGIGIPADRHDQVFMPFEQLDSYVAHDHVGTGLGLALSRSFVQMQGGTMSVESEPGAGSRFTFTLPLHGTPSAADVDGGGDGNLSTGPLQAQVLVVEDNEVNRLLVTDHLAVHGIRTAVAADGDEALEMARNLRPDLILMDVQLPSKDGLTVTRELKADAATQHIPIVAVTALAMEGDEERCIEAGCDGYLSKPFDPDDMLAIVEEFLTAV